MSHGFDVGEAGLELSEVETPPAGHPTELLSLSGALREAGIDPTPRGVPYCTEACIWVPELGIPAVICGPGSPGMAHQPDEFTPVRELELAAKVYEGVARKLLM